MQPIKITLSIVRFVKNRFGVDKKRDKCRCWFSLNEPINSISICWNSSYHIYSFCNARNIFSIIVHCWIASNLITLWFMTMLLWSAPCSHRNYSSAIKKKCIAIPKSKIITIISQCSQNLWEKVDFIQTIGENLKKKKY